MNLDGAPVTGPDLAAMASLLQRRGPDRTGVWSEGCAGVGHTLLTTTPELAFERQPFTHQASGCIITADVRLDNREELLAATGLSERVTAIGDAELIVEAYLKWGEDGVAQLLGDFAFAIWDPKRRAMFCARDQFGMRPFYYHHVPGRLLAFASEPRAILVLPQVPCQINDGRVADYLVPQLEWIDYTSTFFNEVFRLPPAHALTVTPSGLTLRRYWTLEPGAELQLSSNAAYAEAMGAVLTEAVRSRLRSVGPAGVLLSGGLDSSSVVAVARDLLALDGRLPLRTFSGVSPDAEACIESRSIRAVLEMDGLKPHLVDYSALEPLLPELEDAGWDLEEPFDRSMVIARCLYLSAGHQGVRVLLDGAASDVVLSAGTHAIRLMRQGRVMAGLAESRGMARFQGAHSTLATTFRDVGIALTPNVARQLRTQVFRSWRSAACVRNSLISRDLARRVSLTDRLRTLDVTTGRQQGWIPDYRRERAMVIHPSLTAGRERYGRLAASAGVEALDPFVDRRVVAFCLTLPGSQRIEGGWPKVILRRAMAGRLPETVLWRRFGGHIGWSFLRALMKIRRDRTAFDRSRVFETLEPFVDERSLTDAWRGFSQGDESDEGRVYEAIALAGWIRRASVRPGIG